MSTTKTTVRTLLISAPLLFGLLALACSQKEGERCEVNRDCEDGLICDVNSSGSSRICVSGTSTGTGGTGETGTGGAGGEAGAAGGGQGGAAGAAGGAVGGSGGEAGAGGSAGGAAGSAGGGSTAGASA